MRGWLSGLSAKGILCNLFDQRFDPYCLHVYCYTSTKNVQVGALLPANFKEKDKNLNCVLPSNYYKVHFVIRMQELELVFGHIEQTDKMEQTNGKTDRRGS